MGDPYELPNALDLTSSRSGLKHTHPEIPPSKTIKVATDWGTAKETSNRLAVAKVSRGFSASVTSMCECTDLRLGPPSSPSKLVWDQFVKPYLSDGSFESEG